MTILPTRGSSIEHETEEYGTMPIQVTRGSAIAGETEDSATHTSNGSYQAGAFDTSYNPTPAGKKHSTKFDEEVKKEIVQATVLPFEPFKLSIRDGFLPTMMNFCTLTLFDGIVSIPRMRDALSRTLDAYPVFGGRLRKAKGADIVNGLSMLTLGVLVPDPMTWMSMYEIHFPEGNHGAELTTRMLDPNLEDHLLNGRRDDGSLEGTFWGRFSDPQWRDELNALQVPTNPDHPVEDRPLTFLTIAQGTEYAVMGLSVSSKIADADSYYRFFNDLAQCYNCPEVHLEPVPHIGNEMSRRHPHDFDSAQSAPGLNTQGTGIMANFNKLLRQGMLGWRLISRRNGMTRSFLIRLSKENRDAMKKVVKEHWKFNPPYSTNDCLVELFAPEEVENLSITLNMRKRFGFGENATGNLVQPIIKRVKNGMVNHNDVRDLVDNWDQNAKTRFWTPANLNKDFGWNTCVPTCGLPHFDDLPMFAHNAIGTFFHGMPEFQHINWMHANVIPDSDEAWSLLIYATSPDHARKISSVCEQFELPYRAVGKRSGVDALEVISSSDIPGRLYRDLEEEEEHAHEFRPSYGACLCGSLLCYNPLWLNLKLYANRLVCLPFTLTGMVPAKDAGYTPLPALHLKRKILSAVI